MNKKNTLIPLDKIGMCTSIICMIHCMAIPFLVLFGFDSVLKFVDQEWLELSIIGSGFVVGILAFLGGFKSHRQHFVPVLFVAGFLLIVNGESVSNAWISAGLSVSGAALIVYAHVQNLKLRRYAFTR